MVGSQVAPTSIVRFLGGMGKDVGIVYFLGGRGKDTGMVGFLAMLGNKLFKHVKCGSLFYIVVIDFALEEMILIPPRII
jgi:hypothetical protein